MVDRGHAPTSETSLRGGRTAFARQHWARAYACLRDADASAGRGSHLLAPEDLDALATAAWLIGHEEVAEEVGARAHAAFVAAGEKCRAARCAFWLGRQRFDQGQLAAANGWYARAERLLGGVGECPERGLLLLPAAMQQVFRGDFAAATRLTDQAAEVGERLGDPDLVALARGMSGRGLIRQGRVEHGLRLLDEAMVTVSADPVCAMVAGEVYCTAIEGCMEVMDVGRAREWTRELTRWCAEQPGLVPYRGQCSVHRAEMLLLRGRWAQAAVEADRAFTDLRARHRPGAGAAAYLRGELHRLQGSDADAERCYVEAERWGHPSQPGAALLRLAEGRTDQAAAGVRGALAEAGDPSARLRVLCAAVEVLLDAGDLQAADAAAEELAGMAATAVVPYVRAAADHARGAVQLARGDADQALRPLRRALAGWQLLDVPHFAARTQSLQAAALTAVGDHEGAAVARACAGELLAGLGAPPVDRHDETARDADDAPAAGLTARESEVLRLLATGMTNRSIAAALVISDKTVARHVDNLFTKLAVSTRSAATAWAYEHGVVSRRG